MILLFVACVTQAQRTRYGNIKGTVTDSLNHQPVEAATVSVFTLSDSSMVNYAITNRRGEFLIKDIPVGARCQLLVSCNGMRSHVESFTIPEDKKEWIIGPIRLAKLFKELEEVMVLGQRPPLLIKKDTLEFNAGSFRTMSNAVLEDLLKQLPGVDVDKDGKITINGRRVNKITVDGREFFGNDPQVALKNLPRNIIDKIQVMDNKTRQNQFNKTSRGDEDKVINLTLKRDQKKGWFGRIIAGYGSEKRYESGASLNFFDDKKQINFIGNINNTNRMNSSGGSFNINNAQSSFGGGGSGITESKAAGLNFSNAFNKKLTLSGSYFYNGSYFRNNTRLERQNILPDTSFLYNAINNNSNENRDHRLNVGIDYRPDSMTNFYLNASFNKTKGMTGTGNDAFSSSMKGDLINASKNTLSGSSDIDGFATEIFIGRRLKKEGRGISMNLNFSTNDQSALDYNIGKNIYYKTDGTNTIDTIDQESRSGNTSKAFSFSFSYSEPLIKNLTMLLRYNYVRNIGKSDKTTNRLNPVSGEYDLPDTLFTNAFRNNSTMHNPDISLVFNKSDRLRSTLGMGVQWLTQENISTLKNDLGQRYTNIFPSASLSYQYSKKGEVSIYYNGSSQQPSILQLQPIPDNSNPLYIQTGNPDLRPSFNHNINMAVRQSGNKAYWYGTLNIFTISNQIINETWYDSVGRQVSRPVNVNGNYGLSGNAAFSRSWKKRSLSVRLNAGLNGNYNRNVVFTNKVRNSSDAYGITSRLALSGTYKELITLAPSYSLRFNDARYSIQAVQDAGSVTHQFTMDFFWNWPKRLIIENNVQYIYNSRIAPGFKKGVTIWNAAVSYQVFKDQQGMIRFAVYDLLKQNTNIFRSITQTYIQDMQVQVLQRYCMLSFIYNLRKFGQTK